MAAPRPKCHFPITTTAMLQAGENRSKRLFQERNILREVRAQQQCAAAEYRAAEEEARKELEPVHLRRARIRSEGAARARRRIKTLTQSDHSSRRAQIQRVGGRNKLRDDAKIPLRTDERVKLAAWDQKQRELALEESRLKIRKARCKNQAVPKLTVVSRPELFKLELEQSATKFEGHFTREDLFYDTTAKARCEALKWQLNSRRRADESSKSTLHDVLSPAFASATSARSKNSDIDYIAQGQCNAFPEI